MRMYRTHADLLAEDDLCSDENERSSAPDPARKFLGLRDPDPSIIKHK
jgi:hypothetical protein